MKYFIELNYNTCSTGSLFSVLVYKEKEVSSLIDHVALNHRQFFEKVTRYSTTIHPRGNVTLLSFTLSVETNSLSIEQVKEIFDIDRDIVIEVREED